MVEKLSEYDERLSGIWIMDGQKWFTMLDKWTLIFSMDLEWFSKDADNFFSGIRMFSFSTGLDKFF